jgi:hypothetical protein
MRENAAGSALLSLVPQRDQFSASFHCDSITKFGLELPEGIMKSWVGETR